MQRERIDEESFLTIPSTAPQACPAHTAMRWDNRTLPLYPNQREPNPTTDLWYSPRLRQNRLPCSLRSFGDNRLTLANQEGLHVHSQHTILRQQLRFTAAKINRNQLRPKAGNAATVQRVTKNDMMSREPAGLN